MPINTDQANLLLEKIKNLSPEELSATVSNATTFNRGLSYFKYNKLLSFKWEENFLEAAIQGSHIYTVRLSLTPQADLITSCSCPAWDSFDQCKHVICGLLTIREILSENFQNTSSHALLAKRLLHHHHRKKTEKLNSTASGLEIVLHKPKNDPDLFNFSLSFQFNGKHLPPNSKRIPPVFRNLFSYNYLPSPYDPPSPDPGIILQDFLTKPTAPFNLLIHTETGLEQVRWDVSNPIHLKIAINWTSQNIFIQPLAYREQSIISSFIVIGGLFLCDLKNLTLSPIFNPDVLLQLKAFLETKLTLRPQNINPFDYSSAYEYEYNSSISGPFPTLCKPFPLSKSDLAKSPFILPESSRSEGYILFLKDNLPIDPKIIDIPLRISLGKTSSPDTLAASLEGYFQNKKIDLTHHPLFHFMSLNLPTSVAGGEISRETSKHFLRLKLLELAQTPLDHQEQAFKEALQEVRCKMRFWDFPPAENILGIFQNLLNARGFYQLWAGEEELILLKIDLVKNILIQGCLAHLFPKAAKQIWVNQYIFLPKAKTFRSLSKLQREMASFNVPLFFESRILSPITLDFKLKAERSSEKNWFEVHPEISSGEKNLAQDQWQSLLDTAGILIDETEVRIIDEESLEKLKKLAAFINKRKNYQGNEKRDYVKIPSLQIFDWLIFKKMGIELDLPEEDKQLVERLMQFRKIPPRRIPSRFQGTLRDYQKEGYHWLAFLYEHRLGGCLADDMGLGKTIQAIAFLAGLREEIIGLPSQQAASSHEPHLIVMPSSLLFNWESEIKKFYPEFRLKIYAGAERNLDFQEADIVLTTYDFLRRDAEKLSQICFHTVLFDEAQMIKNIFSSRAASARLLKSRFKACLTGTPLENHVGEYFSVMDLCVPGLLGAYEDFRRDMRSDETDSLSLRTRAFVLRRTKEKILSELPSKTETDVYLPMTATQKAFYIQTAERVRGDIEKAYEEKTEAQARIIALTGMLRLRQICVSPELVSKKINESSPKIEHLLEKIREIKEEGHAALIFSQFTSCLDILQKELKKEKINFFRLDGRTPFAQRRTLVEGFQRETGPSLFLISLKAGGFGLNLTRANYVFHLDPWWNPAVDRQATDRVHRIGQEKKVFVTRILMKHTIEEKVMELRREKWELFQAVMNDQNEEKKNGKPISRKDFDFLLSS